MEQTAQHSNCTGFSVTDLPPAVRAAFGNIRSFNKIQQAVAPTILQTDDSLVVNAPTGSGKTVILELAIAKLAMQSPGHDDGGNGFRIVYLAPTRSLCAEKYSDWKTRLAPLGIECIQYNGDNVVEDIRKLSNYQLILSTPEKWEVFTRHWADRNAATVLRPVKLFLIDEVQVIEDSERGANLELVVARMKYIDARLNSQADLGPLGEPVARSGTSIRFIAVSACIPNVGDFARWLQNDRKVVPFSFAETDRQTTLERHVLGYPFHTSPFKFELNLNYKLPDIIAQYSRSKPTLIFCSSRKSAETTASFLARTGQPLALPSAPTLREIGSGLVGKQLQELIGKGVAYHHAGLLASDRVRIENSFREGHLGVLCCTSTLCMGVNLPAYLVIIKATFNHLGKDYANNYLLQMMGRAGRSQYNEHGVAVVMTTEANVERYRKLVSDTLPIESQLHQKLPELLNSEIAHGIIYDRAAVREWIRSTFFYVRAQTNPGHYQLAAGSVYNMDDQIERLCETTLESLQASGLVVANRPNILQPAPSGRLMARNHLSFKTMQLLLAEMVGDETVAKMLSLIARADEFSAFKCRNNEKRLLNGLNMPTGTTGAECAGVRFRWPGRISTTDAKVYCLIQAVFGCLSIHDHSLHQEAAKMITLGARICRCIIGLLNANRDRFHDAAGSFRALYSASTLAQCFEVKLWENSPLVSRQLRGIGARLAQHLADRGKSTFRAIRSSDPRELECIVKKQPPFGNELIGLASILPDFAIELTKTVLKEEQQRVAIACTVQQRNDQYLVTGTPLEFSLLVGDSSNRLLLYETGLFSDRILAREGKRWTIQLADAAVESITAHLICCEWVGLDGHQTLALVGDREIIATKQTTITSFFPNETANDTLQSTKNMTFIGPTALDALHSIKDMSFAGPTALDASRWNNTSVMERSYLLATSNGTCRVTIEPSRVLDTSTTTVSDTSIRLPVLPPGTSSTLPLRSILKKTIDVPFRSAPFVAHRTACTALETSRNGVLNDSSVPVCFEEVRETIKRMPPSEPFFDENERRHLFRRSVDYGSSPPPNSWFGGTEAEDILACFNHCNVFVSLSGVKRGLVHGFNGSEDTKPLPEPRVFASNITSNQWSFTGGSVQASGGRKRKHFDLGRAADVICVD
ncbi:probable ATP-dependent DNA helicase HFM1 [Anopheles albimanus]|uniref:DNA 3'-5' helicase n=1 Tax=Anopheles albimanus TaxID=7167 RepID=A0A8W7J9J1_ANOAL|nr:probable ATP-dependent DNA helicase HFM1 [Anopheles albimanus]